MKRIWLAPCVATLLVVFAGAYSARADELVSPALASAESRELWHKSSDQVLAGDFSAAARSLARLRQDHPDDRTITAAADWVERLNKLSASREKLRAKIYTRHVEKAHEYQKDSKWQKALNEVYYALQASPNEAEFRKQEWIKAIAASGAKKAAELREKSQWKEAYILFETLHLIFPDDEAYKRQSRGCRQHAHFETYYTKKGEWKSDLKEIEPDMVGEILARIAQEYVRDADFKKLCVSGLENAVLLAQTRKIDTVFSSLGDADLVGNFVDRVEQQIGKIKRRTRFDQREAADEFDKLLRINRETIDLPENVLVDEFVAGAMEPLDDFSSVIWPSETSEFAKHTRGEFVGVGIQITKDLGGFIRVESPLEDTPAYEAGVSPGDLITAVDGRSTEDVDVNDAVRLITGEPGTKVALTIRNRGGQERTLVLPRRKIKLPTVRGVTRRDGSGSYDYMLDAEQKVGYVRINSFMEQTADDLKAVLEQLERQGCRALMLDLRFNPGGLLKSAVEVSNLFLDEDRSIVMTKGRTGRQDMEVSAKAGAGFRDWPIIILTNEASASASEIVAGALSGHGKACVVGSRTYGKGSVQNLIPIGGNIGYLKLTTQYYYVPTGNRDHPWRCLHREEQATHWGVDPDIEVKLLPTENAKVYRLRRKTEILKGKGQDEIPKDMFETRRPTTKPADGDDGDEADDDAKLDDMPDVDPQLMVALQVMRMKLLSNQPWAHVPKFAARDPFKRD